MIIFVIFDSLVLFNLTSIAGFEVFTVMKIQVVVVWVVMLCSDVVGYHHFREKCCFHLHWLSYYITTWHHNSEDHNL